MTRQFYNDEVFIKAVLVILWMTCSLFGNARPPKEVRLSSPDGRIVFIFEVASGQATYSVQFKRESIISRSTFGLVFSDGDLGRLSLLNTNTRDGIEEYELVVGKNSKVKDRFKELTINLQQSVSPGRKMNLIVRIFNDGLAFRYEFPSQAGWATLNLDQELTAINLQGDPMAHILFLPGYTTSHEGAYSDVKYKSIREDSLIDMPALFELPGPVFVGITEAALSDYAGMYLTKHKGILVSRLSPFSGSKNLKVKAPLPHVSPWRVIMISDQIGRLIESNILTNLNEPCAIKDLSWIRPGKSTWPWWNGNVVPDTLNAPGMNFVTAKHYIDFCAKAGLEYHSVVEYGLHQWYTDDGVGFMPGPHSDVTKPVPGLDMKEICDYAKSKGVGIRVWVHWAALYPKLDSAFSKFEQWGISGMMIDFMDRDDHEMVNIQTEMLQKAARHRLHVQFHGAYKPTGLSRTYPNEFTREGTLNYETNKWDPKGLSPDHDIHMPFTRLLAGPTDYHLGGFRAVHDNKYVLQYTRPMVLGTRSHMLAMYVVLESYLQLVCDYPAAYDNEPGFTFIQQVPTTWDETIVVSAVVNEYVVIARRKGETWYLGAITNGNERRIDIPLTFLDPGTYSAEMYSDALGPKADPNSVSRVSKKVNQSVMLGLGLAAGGGAAIIFLKQ